MNKTRKIIAGMMILFFVFSFASVAFAADIGCSDTGTYSSSKGANGFWPLVQCGNTGQHCCDFTEAMNLVNRIVNWFISISTVIAAITFSIAGANILLNPGNPAKISDGWDMFRKTVIGMFIILSAWFVVHLAVTKFTNPDTKAGRFLQG